MKQQMSGEDTIKKITRDLLAALIEYIPDTAALLVEHILAEWGNLRVLSGVSRDVRGPAALFCKNLGRCANGFALSSSLLPPGRKNLDITQVVEEARTWATQYASLPFDLALDGFTLAVYEWLRTVDLHAEIKDGSSNQLIYFQNGWYLDLV